MEESVRIVLIEDQRRDYPVAAQLLAYYDLDFSWLGVASSEEAREIAAAFNPSIVLSTDGMIETASHAALDALRLLCSRRPLILVLDVRVMNGSPAVRRAQIEQATAPGFRRPLTAAARSVCKQDVQLLRSCFASVLESSSRPIVMSDGHGWITYANAGACLCLGEVFDGALGTVFASSRNQPHGSPHWLDTAVCDEAGLHHLAYFDTWTGAPTRVHVSDLIACVKARSHVGRRTAALVAVAVESGRIAPDTALSETLSYGSIVRITQEDFMMTLPDLSSPASAMGTLLAVLDSSASVDDLPLPRRRDRRLGAEHREEAPQAAKCSEHLAAELGDALSRGALSLQYQPQYALDTGFGCGVEALARWVRVTGEIVSPAQFIPIAERSGMIAELGAWVLKSACETAASWCKRHDRSALAVNVSALQIDDKFCVLLERVLKHSGFPAQQLELEITESALISNPIRAIELLKNCRTLGVHFALDDFGTGYSSLSCLARLPVDRIKLDKSLIAMMTIDTRAAAIARSIVSLAADLDMEVIAEGVETEDQLQMLVDLGCPRGQGYLLGRPMQAKQAQVALGKLWGNRPTLAPRLGVANLGANHVH
jgi:EAL domain-containing protein (putative c-di-GMP-specific phosphodiesterase class I)/PAS domain-containing protein